MLHQNIPQSKDVESILRTEVLVESTNLSCQFVGIVCARAMHSTTKIRNDVSEQVCVCVYMCISIYIYIYISTHILCICTYCICVCFWLIV